MINNNMQISEEIKKIFESYTLSFHKYLNLKLEEKEKKVYLDEIFDQIDNQIEKDYQYSNGIFDRLKKFSEKYININIIKYLFRIYFLSSNISILSEYSKSDRTEKIFMKLNCYLSEMLNNKNLFISMVNNSKIINISWTRNIVLNSYNFFSEPNLSEEDRCIKYTISQKYFYCISDEKFSTDDKKIILLFFYISKTIYEFFIERILVLNNSNEYSFSEEKLEIDKEYYSVNKKIKLKDNLKENVNILHLSDLHIKKDTNNFSKKFFDEFYSHNLFLYQNEQFIQTKQIIKDIDIIVVTGDIANAGTSSKEILDNYLNANIEIKKIAQSILGNLWKERLLIIPGNHDYGMINELKIELKDRSYKGADLISDSKELEKFIFFHFIFESELLDGNIEKISKLSNPRKVSFNLNIKNDGSGKINFYLFNTAYLANTIRSNKIKLKYTKFESNEKDVNIMLMHHTPLLEVNYYLDTLNYLYDYKLLLFGCNKSERDLIYDQEDETVIEHKIIEKNAVIEKINNGLASIKSKINSGEIKIINKDYNWELFKDEDDLYEEIYNDIHLKILKPFYDIDLSKKISLKDILIEKIEDKINDFKKIKLKNEIAYSFLCDKKSNEKDEVFDFSKKTFISYFKESVVDEEQYLAIFNKYLQDLKNCVVLGGHYHKQRFYTGEGYDVFECGKTFDDKKYNYGVIRIKTDNLHLSYYSSTDLSKTNSKNIYEDNE